MKKSTFAPFAAQATSWLTHIRLRSLRVRLALWGLLLLGITQVAVSIVFYVAISTWLEDQVNNNLLLTATQVSSVLYDAEDVQRALDIADVRLQLAGNNIATEGFLRNQLFFVRLIDISDGTVLASSVDYTVPLPQLRGGEESFATVLFDDLDETKEIRLYTLLLSYAPGLALQVGVSLEETREIQRDVRSVLVMLLVVIGTLAPLSGWFLANRALVPIRATARTAAEINETELSRRLDLVSSEIELEQLVLTFNSMLDRIEQAFQRQRQFTADAAHELRTPLAIMQAGLEVTLSQERSESEYRSALVSIQEEVQRLSRLAITLLMLARVDMHEPPLQLQEVDLGLVLNTVIEQFGLIAEAKHISIERVIAPNLRLEGDEDRLIQVVFNLVDNAVKYTPEGGQIKVLAHEMGKSMQIAVEDTGSGISLAEQAHIFDRFYRTDSSRNRNQGGFGLGLAIVKRVVDLHHGTVRVTSEPGRGARFIITLPKRYVRHG